jgi:methylphosphotriester-DNA--protein-cysteine methyltransferase
MVGTKPGTYRLLGTDGRWYRSPAKGLFGGNARMKIYGRLDCPSALRAIKRGPTYARHRVFFADQESAVAAGFRPCAVCMRDAYNRWKTNVATPADRNNYPRASSNSTQTVYRPDKKR